MQCWPHTNMYIGLYSTFFKALPWPWLITGKPYPQRLTVMKTYTVFFISLIVIWNHHLTSYVFILNSPLVLWEHSLIIWIWYEDIIAILEKKRLVGTPWLFLFFPHVVNHFLKRRAECHISQGVPLASEYTVMKSLLYLRKPLVSGGKDWVWYCQFYPFRPT